jgi:hypothetical protein
VTAVDDAFDIEMRRITGPRIAHSQKAAGFGGWGMMYIYPGELRVFHLSRRSEVFVPASQEDAARFYAAFERDLFETALPQRFRLMINILDDAFPRVGAACRRAGVLMPVARVGTTLLDYEFDPDAVLDEVWQKTGRFDLKLNFQDRTALARFLQEYATLVRSSAGV